MAMQVFRYVVFGVVALAALAAAGAMAIQRRALNPFGRTARLLRQVTDPVLKPIERRVLRSGGNPQSAPWWMLGMAVLSGILLIAVVEWVIREATLARIVAESGSRGVLRLAVSWLFALLNIALIVRVIGSWLNVGRWTPWMRPFHWLTEWFLAPLRRVLPPLGPFDLSPIVAWFALGLLRQLVLGAI